MKIFLFSLIIGFNLISCSDDILKNNYTLFPTQDSLNFKLGKSELNHTLCNQYFTNNDDNFLAVLNQNLNKIFIYSLESQKLYKEITIQTEGKDAFPNAFSFVMKNMDTIILAAPWPQNVGLIDGNGKLIKKVSYEKDENGKNLQSVAGMTGQRSILIDNILNMVQHYRFDPSGGKLTASTQKNTNVAISINLEKGVVKSLPLNYPIELVDKDFSGVSVLRELGFNNSYIYNFGISSDLYITQDFSNFKRVPIETSYDLKLPENQFKYMSDLIGGLNYLIQKDNIQNIYYDKFRECYYIVVRKRTSEPKENENFRIKFIYPHCFIIILDKEFKHMGDVHFPDNTYSFNDLFIANEGIYISEDHVNNPTYCDDAMRFRLFKLKEIEK